MNRFGIKNQSPFCFNLIFGRIISNCISCHKFIFSTLTNCYTKFFIIYPIFYLKIKFIPSHILKIFCHCCVCFACFVISALFVCLQVLTCFVAINKINTCMVFVVHKAKQHIKAQKSSNKNRMHFIKTQTIKKQTSKQCTCMPKQKKTHTQTR